MALGCRKEEKKTSLGQGAWPSREGQGVRYVLGLFPCGLHFSLRAEGVVIWAAFREGQRLGRRCRSHGQQHRVLRLREAFCHHVRERKSGPALHSSCLLHKHSKSSLHSKGNSAKSQN